jgi:hypothetical protein
MNLANGIEPPRSRIIINENHTINHLNNLVMNHPFNFSIDVIVNSHSYNKSHFEQILSKHQWFSCNASPKYFAMLLQHVLSLDESSSNSNHVLYLHTIGGRSESANMIAIYPKFDTKEKKHVMYLQVDKDTYEQLGLEGSLVDTFTHHNYHDRLYKSQYKVIQEWPIKSQKVLDRVMWALERLSDTPALLSVYKQEGDNYTSTNLKPIIQSLNNESTAGSCKYKIIDGFGTDPVVTQLTVPIIENEDYTNENLVREVIHTTGCLSTKVPITSLAEILDNLEITDKERSITHLAVKGYIPPHTILNLVSLLKNQQRQQQSEWDSIFVRGIEDCVVSWKENAHGFGLSGENDYALIFKGNDFISCQIVGQLDQL